MNFLYHLIIVLFSPLFYLIIKQFNQNLQNKLKLIIFTSKLNYRKIKNKLL